MDINMIFFLNIIFISMINILGGIEALLCSLLFILIIYLKKQDITLTVVLVVISIFLYINYNLKTIENLEINKTYEFKIEVVSNSAKILKTDGKYLKIDYYPILDEFFEDGSYNVLGRVDKIKDTIVEIIILKDEKVETPIKDLLDNKVENMIYDFPYNFQKFTKAILLGRKDGISLDIKKKFNYTGTAHILVISGLHIGIIIFSILFILKKLSYQIRYGLAGIILTLYCYGIGFTPSVLRAYIMGILYLSAKIFYEEREMKKALILAFIVSSFINPYAIRSISYQMSYLALVGILFLYPKIKEDIKEVISEKFERSKIIDYVILSFSIQVMLMPIFLYYFRSIPLFSFIINIIVIPIGSLTVQVLFLAFLLSFIGIGKFLVPLGYYFYKILDLIIDIFYKIPFLTLTFYVKISVLLFIYLYFLILFFIIFEIKIIKKYWYIVLGIVPLIFIGSFQRDEKLDLEQIYYRNTSNRILFLNKEPDRRDLLLLKDSGIKRLDYIVTSYNLESEELKKAYPRAEYMILNKGEKIEVEDEYFINKKGKIKVKKSKR